MDVKSGTQSIDIHKNCFHSSPLARQLNIMASGSKFGVRRLVAALRLIKRYSTSKHQCKSKVFLSHAVFYAKQNTSISKTVTPKAVPSQIWSAATSRRFKTDQTTFHLKTSKQIKSFPITRSFFTLGKTTRLIKSLPPKLCQATALQIWSAATSRRF